MTPRASVCCALETRISIYFQASLHLIKLTCTLLLNEDFLKDRIKTPAYLCLVHMTLFVAQWFHTYSICYSDCFKLSQIFVSASITSGQMCVYIKRCIYPFFPTIHFTGVFLTSVQKYNVKEGGKSHISSAPVFVTLVDGLVNCQFTSPSPGDTMRQTTIHTSVNSKLTPACVWTQTRGQYAYPNRQSLSYHQGLNHWWGNQPASICRVRPRNILGLILHFNLSQVSVFLLPPHCQQLKGSTVRVD